MAAQAAVQTDTRPRSRSRPGCPLLRRAATTGDAAPGCKHAPSAPGHRHDLTVARDAEVIGALNWACRCQKLCAPHATC
jgi:hypothetical protein